MKWLKCVVINTFSEKEEMFNFVVQEIYPYII